MKVSNEDGKERRRRELTQSVAIHLYRNWRRSGQRGGDWRDGEGRECEGGPWGGQERIHCQTPPHCT